MLGCQSNSKCLFERVRLKSLKSGVCTKTRLRLRSAGKRSPVRGERGGSDRDSGSLCWPWSCPGARPFFHSQGVRPAPHISLLCFR